MPTLVIGAVFRHRNLPGKPSLRQYLALNGGQGERHLRRRLRDRVSDLGRGASAPLLF